MLDETQKTVGQDIIEGLSELLEAVRNKVPLSEEFTVRSVPQSLLESEEL
jgi:hypothetical protein